MHMRMNETSNAIYRPLDNNFHSGHGERPHLGKHRVGPKNSRDQSNHRLKY